jgi:hypothetical protein
MAFDASNIYSRVHDWVADRVAGVKIRADRMDAEFDAVAVALTALGQNTLDPVNPYVSVKGSAAAPGITFLGDLDSGITSLGADQLELVANGVVQLSVNTAGVDGIIGATTPAAGTFTTGTIATADINGGAIDGTIIGGTVAAAVTGTTLRVTSTTDVDLGTTGHGIQIGPNSGANLAMDTNEIQGRNNGAAADLFFNLAGGNVSIGANCTVTNGGKISLEGTGTASLPTIYFGGDSNSGFYRSAEGILNMTTQGVVRTTWGGGAASAFSVTGSASVSDVLTAGTTVRSGIGSAAAPAFSFTVDDNTGIYSSGANLMSVALAGVEEARFQAGTTNSDVHTVQTREKADARYLAGTRLGTERTTTVSRPAGVAGVMEVTAPDGSAIVSVSIEKDSSGEIIELIVKDRPVQQSINGAWSTVAVV